MISFTTSSNSDSDLLSFTISDILVSTAFKVNVKMTIYTTKR